MKIDRLITDRDDDFIRISYSNWKYGRRLELVATLSVDGYEISDGELLINGTSWDLKEIDIFREHFKEVDQFYTKVEKMIQTDLRRNF